VNRCTGKTGSLQCCQDHKYFYQLGQVASQTLDNLLVLTDAAEIPVYRPLIGFDKEDAIRIAREIGTFSESISNASGCKAVPKGPSTAAKLEKIHQIEADLTPVDIPRSEGPGPR